MWKRPINHLHRLCGVLLYGTGTSIHVCMRTLPEGMCSVMEKYHNKVAASMQSHLATQLRLSPGAHSPWPPPSLDRSCPGRWPLLTSSTIFACTCTATPLTRTGLICQ